jgi:Icc-related predicted phosphoesterase
MMKVLAISDLHGYFPEIPECDLLLLGGDYCPTRNHDQEKRFMLGPFTEWLRSIKARYIVGIAGNHDFILQDDPKLAKELPWIYLQDSGVDIEGVKIWGSPWTLPFFNWAFMKGDNELRQVFNPIPKGLDILLTHGPAYRILDKTLDGPHAGSFSLLERIREVKPDSHVFGHIHEARGITDGDVTRHFNVSHVTAKYEPKNGPVTIQLRMT